MTAPETTQLFPAPSLYTAVEELLNQGGRGVVRGGIDHVPYMHPAMTNGWRGLRRGLMQSYFDVELAAPGMGLGIWLGYQLRDLLAPLTLRAKPLPTPVKAGLAIGALYLLARRLGQDSSKDRQRNGEARGLEEGQIDRERWLRPEPVLVRS